MEILENQISKRIKVISSYTKGYNTVVDVGCDHGYTLYYALTNNFIKYGIGSENKKAPFANALKTLEHLNAKVYFTNGVDNIKEDYDCIVASGLGVDTIISVVNKLERKIPLILAPNSKYEKLREYLFNNNYYINREEVIEDDFFYIVMEALPGKKEYSEEDILFGPILKKDKNSINYYKFQLQLNENILKNISFNDNKYIKIKNKIFLLQNLINNLLNTI
jgi:tRNA (adenine22-N1)-methyltransferase